MSIDIEETTVLIVGAGPSGLALGALLGRMNIKVVILEKEVEVCEDPRGIVVNGDAVRISYQIGIGEGLTKRIGKDIGVLNFHRGNFRQPTFMTFDITVDWAEQAVSNNLTQFQPNYEREIRNLITQFPTCEIRTGCEAIAREENGDHTILEYVTQDGTKRYIRTSWLVGADGKRGVVRKKFLEPEGIRQEDGFYTYVGTWVAANLHITTPTPKSHPQFPLWQLGYTPQQVHDAFWPSGFHSKRPAVSGRFGPPNSGFWRHEFSVEPEDNLKDVEGDFWKQFGSWMIIPGSKFSWKLRKTLVEFPRDCIKIVRCRPFTFATKVVNRWYCRKTMLIGDAAHVFPPFGGQGIAAGIRDAQALSWRLALMTNLGVSVQIRERILTGWSQERRHAWNAATLATKLNGGIVNQRSLLGGLVYRMWMRFLWWFPGIARLRTRRAFRDKLVYSSKTCPDGFFLEKAGGGRKVAQIWVRRQGEKPALSDGVFLRSLPHFGLLVIVRSLADANPKEIEEAIRAADLPEEILTSKDVTFFCLNVQAGNSLSKLGAEQQTYYPCRTQELLEEGITPIKGYRETAVQDRYAKSARYVLIRPDFFVHSVAANAGELAANLREVKGYFS
ncbi:hypothetical protein D8B26_008052 [Coccidioides posadasii str. Silveira]|uniref:uncharacterized protein n=1 Tax=Coccidioides posadasii (strain RMSCC 757 / Silveira) TaxID=443226 RepID=UPI001BF049C8|nr:hypothetical protein D8B26_008052 [Coccidioides posadasii str. Silveira]